MKKLLLAGILAVSASAFAMPGGFHHDRGPRHFERHEYMCVTHRNGETTRHHRVVRKNMPEDLRISMEKMRIDIRQRRLNIEKLLLENPVDWGKIEEENRQIGVTQGKMRTEMQKYMMTAEDTAPVPPVKPMPVHHPEPNHVL